MADKSGRVAVLDGLRGFAIFIVVWYHIWQQSWLWPEFNIFGLHINLSFLPRVGFFGVEIFFIISGFGLFYSFARNKLEGAPMTRWRDFYKRRLLRILPSYYLLLLIIVPFTENFPAHLDKTWYLIRHILCINSLFPDTFGSLYNGVLWSLSVEVQFYAIFPIICLIMLKSPIATFLTVCAFSNFYRLLVLVSDPYKFSFFFNQLPGTLDLFVAGMFAAYVCVRLKKRFAESEPSWLKPAGTIISVSAFFALLELFKSEGLLTPPYMPDGAHPIQLWQSHIRWILIILVVLIIIGGCFCYKAWAAVFANKAAVFLAAISYNLYLWHAYIALALKYRFKIPAYELVDGKLPNIIGNTGWQIGYSILAAALSILAAAIITYAFERPMAKIRRHAPFKNL